MIKNRWATTALFIATLSCSITFAQSDSLQRPLLTLEEAVVEALQKSYDIRLARIAGQVAENNVSLGNAGFLPRVDADFANNWTISNTEQQFVDGREVSNPRAGTRNLSAGVGATWTIFDGLAMFKNYEILETNLDLSQLVIRQAMRTTVADVSAAYYEVVYQSLLADALVQAMNLSRFRSQLAYERWQVGDGSRLNHRLALLDFNSDSTAYLQQQQRIEAAKVQLNTLLNRPPTDDYRVETNIVLADTLLYAELREQLIRNNIDLQIQEQNVLLAQQTGELIRTERFPVISLSTGYGYNRFRTDAGLSLGRKNLDWDYGISARINLFNGFNLRRRIENAELELIYQQNLLSQNRQRLDGELRTNFTQYDFFRQLIALERENIAIAQENVTVETERFQLGAGSNLEVREAEQQLLDTRNRFIISLYNAKLAEIELLRLSTVAPVAAN